MDYLGGTYSSQVQAESKEQAMQVWIDNLKVEEIKGFTEQDRKNVITAGFNENDPCMLTGIVNTWHFIFRTKKGTAFINFVQTVS